MKAYKNKRVYAIMNHNFFETHQTLPDQLLLDLITISYPTLNIGRKSVKDNEFLWDLFTRDGFKPKPPIGACVDGPRPVTKDCAALAAESGVQALSMSLVAMISSLVASSFLIRNF